MFFVDNFIPCSTGQLLIIEVKDFALVFSADFTSMAVALLL